MSRTHRIRRALMVSAFVALLTAACGVSAAEPYRYGNLEADVPASWLAAHVNVPGVSLVTFNEQKGNAATLFWLEVTPLVDVTPKQLVMDVVEALGANQVEHRSEQPHSRGFEVVLDAKIRGEAVRATFNGFRKNNHLYVLGFAATPNSFDRMGGVRLLQATFNPGERLKEPVPPTPMTVVAKAGTYRLTQQMINDVIALTEFLVARPISAADKLQLRSEMIDEFPTATAKDISDFRSAGTLMNQLATASALNRAQIRRDMTSRVWFDAQKSKEATPLARLIFRYNPILGVDEALGLVVPRASVDALLASNSFVATKAGFKPYTPEDRDRYAAEIRSAFGTLNEKQKRYLVNGEVNWLKLINAWQYWDEQAQNKHLRIVGANGIKSPGQVARVARNLEHWAGIDSSSREIMKMVAGVSDMMVLQHLRSTIGSR